MSEPFNKTTVAAMAEAAAREIDNLRAQIAALEPKAHAYDSLSTVLGLLPQQSRGYGENMAHKLRRCAEDLRKPDVVEEDGA